MRLFCTMLILAVAFSAGAQELNFDSLRNVLNSDAPASSRFSAAIYLQVANQESNRDTALYYADKAIAVATAAKNNIGIGVGLVCKSYQLMGLGHYADALECLQKGLDLAENEDYKKQEKWHYFPSNFSGDQREVLLSFIHSNYGFLMLTTGSLDEAVVHFKLSVDIAEKIQYSARYIIGLGGLGESYIRKGMPDSAIYCYKTAEAATLKIDTVKFVFARQFLSTFYMGMGNGYMQLGQDSTAVRYYHRSIQWSLLKKTNTILSRDYLKLSEYYIRKGNKDSALYYARNNYNVLLTLGNVTSDETNMGLGYKNLYLAYDMNRQFDSAYKYQKLALQVIDSLDKIKIKNLSAFQTLTYSEEMRLQKLEQDKEKTKNAIINYSLIGGLVIVFLIGIILYRNNLQRKKANAILQEQKEKIESTLHELKSTQAQLIQSEKMASLGELTAGIAHEIQNPLNFVNNFSEVSQELFDEMKIEFGNGNVNEAWQIAEELTESLQKINHHGKRADAIVKGMLQHSRTSSGTKEPTDINALCDEYLRLSYHGLRAKDKFFNADFTTHLDNSVGKINIIPQDIGRVLLNLINNAFYAVNEKKKTAGEDFKPAVLVQTKKVNDKVEIKVEDNGSGIPQNIIDKIFQPFFTTKPTGQGTGLGLSLSYDIVRAHGGEIKVTSKEGEGTLFVVVLPA